MNWFEMLPELVTALLIILSAVFGEKYRSWKNRARVLQALISEINKSMRDDELTEEELESIENEARRLVE